ncbi:MAG: hypothetical protein K2W95_06950 [Candidatus Obscuribacterales bacterium]|nr:hypothetical protein [Candidatus Obscuribacterales bacterium]
MNKRSDVYETIDRRLTVQTSMKESCRFEHNQGKSNNRAALYARGSIEFSLQDIECGTSLSKNDSRCSPTIPRHIDTDGGLTKE